MIIPKPNEKKPYMHLSGETTKNTSFESDVDGNIVYEAELSSPYRIISSNSSAIFMSHCNSKLNPVVANDYIIAKPPYS
ncbi:hypothetical protein K502DRAFT_364424 [Neoconidiobolus thromboides FSU 785]|nr:hypothetical protein K502DRAFT_364424 [Neoconidiobolus thromboides FSU 785]